MHTYKLYTVMVDSVMIQNTIKLMKLLSLSDNDNSLLWCVLPVSHDMIDWCTSSKKGPIGCQLTSDWPSLPTDEGVYGEQSIR